MPTSKQGSLLLYLIMVFGFAMGYLYTSQSDPQAAVPAAAQVSSLQSLEKASIDQSVFTSDQFKALRIFGSLPIQPSGGGKDNPFQ